MELTAVTGSSNDGVTSTASSQLTSATLFKGTIFQLTIGVVSAPTLTAVATGQSGGATVSFNAPVLSVKNLWGDSVGSVNAAHPSLNLPFGLGMLSIGSVTNESLAQDGTQASASASLFTLQLGGPGTWLPFTTLASVSIAPLQVSASVPSGGIACTSTPVTSTGTATTIATTPAHSSITLGQSNSDSAVVTGNTTDGSPTGTVSFFVCGPDATQPSGSSACTSTGTPVGSAVNLTAGSNDTATAASTTYTPTQAGWYCFAAYYTPTPSSTSSGGSTTGSSSSGDDNGDDTHSNSGNNKSQDGDSTPDTTGSGDQGNWQWGWGVSWQWINGLGWGWGWGWGWCWHGQGNPKNPPTTIPGSPYQPSTDTSSAECFKVSAPGTATTTATTPAHSTITLGQSNSDSAVVTGTTAGGSPTGTVAFDVCGPDAAQPSGSSACTSTSTPVGSAANLTTGTGDTATATSASYTPTQTGWYCFAAYYTPTPSTTSTSSGGSTTGSSSSGDDNGDDTHSNSGNNKSQDGDSTPDTTGSGDQGNWQWGWGVSWHLISGFGWGWGWGWGWCWHGQGNPTNPPTTTPQSSSGGSSTKPTTTPYLASSDNSAGECFQVVSGASFTVTKSASAHSVVAGSTTPLDYTLAVDNTGSSASTQPVTVTDTVPAGTTLVSGSQSCPTIASFVSGTAPCTVAVSGTTIRWTIPAGVPAQTTLDLGFAVTVNASASGTISNTAYWTGPGCTTSGGCPSNTVPTTVTSGAAFTVSKSGSPTTVAAGSSTPITYSIGVANTGTSTSTVPVVVTDTVPAGTTLVSGSQSCGSLPSGVSCATSASGSALMWTVQPGVTSGQSLTLTFQVKVDASTTGSVSNTLVWTGQGCTTSGGCPVTVKTPTTVTNNAGFTLTGTGTPKTVSAGGNTPITYSFTAKNTGTSTSTGTVTITDTPTAPAVLSTGTDLCTDVPSGAKCSVSVNPTTGEITWTITGIVSPGQSVTVGYVASVPLYTNSSDTTFTPAGTISNTATVTGPGCASGCSSGAVVNDISTMVVDLSSSPATVTAGTTVPVVYTLNPVYDSPAGTDSTGTLTITAQAPPETTLNATSPSCGSLSKTTTPSCVVSYDSSTGVITWTIGPGLAPGTGPGVTYSVSVNPNSPSGTITNSANYSYSGDDPSTNQVGTGVTNDAAFDVSKAVSVSEVTAGGTTPVKYSIDILNTGVSTSTTGALVTDTAPAGTTLVAGSASCPTGMSSTTTPSCRVSVNSAGLITWDIGSGVTGGASFALTFAVTVNATTTGAVTNQAEWGGPGCTVTATSSGTPCSTNTVSTTINTPAAFTLQKLASAGAVQPGQAAPLTYTLVLQNAGLSTSTSKVTVTDSAPTGTTLVSGSATCGPLPSGVTCSVSDTGGVLTWTVSSGVVPGGTLDLAFEVAIGDSPPATITNTAQWTGPGCTDTSGCGSNQVSVTTTAPATFTVLKLQGASVVSAGQSTPLGYTLDVTNEGASPSTAPVIVTDSAPTGTTYVAGSAQCPTALTSKTTPSCTVVYDSATGLITWTIGAGVGAGQSIDLGFQVSVPDVATTIVNTAAWSGPGCTTSTTCSSNQVSTTVNGPAGISVIKQESAAAVTAGQSTALTYTLVVQNGGLSNSTASVIVTDAAPAGTTLVGSSLSCGALSSTTNPTCSVSDAGGTITWTIGAGLTPGQTVDLSFGVTVNASATGSIANTARWSGPGCTATGGICTTNQVSAFVNSPAGFSVVKQASAPSVTAGQSAALTYTLTVQNGGLSTSTAPVQVTDTAPAGTTYVANSASCGSASSTSTPACTVAYDASTGLITWQIGAGAPAGFETMLSFKVTISSSASGALTNTANWSGPGCTPTTGSSCPTNTVTTPVANASAVTVTKTSTATSVTAGQTTALPYQLAVDNTGASATDLPVVVTDSAPAGTQLIPATVSCGALTSTTTPSCTSQVSGSTVMWTIAAGLPSGTTIDLGFDVSVDATATGSIVNTAYWTGPGCTTTTGCPTGTVTIPVANNAAVVVSKKASASTVVAGQTTPITYTLSADNTGLSSTAQSVLITDSAPAGTTYVSGSATCGSLSATTTPSCTVAVSSAGVITWTIGAGLAAGQTVSVSFDASVNTTASGTITNVASYTAPGCTTSGGCTTTPPTETTVTNGADLTVVKSASPSPVTAGSDLTYTFTVHNAGPSVSAAPEVITDAAPSGTTYVAGSASCGTLGSSSTPSCSVNVASDGTITWSLGSGITPGQSVTVTFEVAVPASASGTITNVGDFTGPGCTPASGSTTCTTQPVHTPVGNAASVSVTKKVSATTVVAGQSTPLGYSLVVVNGGTSDTAASVVVTDTVPAGTTMVPNSASCGTLGSATTPTCSVAVTGTGSAGTSIVWTIGSGLAPSESVALGFSVAVGAGTTQTISNTAGWTGPGCTTSGGCSTNQVSTTVTNGASFSLSGSSTPQTVSVGGTTPISYTFDLNNTGPSTSTQQVVVTEVVPSSLPSKLDLVSGSAACPTGLSASCSVQVTGNTVTWTIGAGVLPGQVVGLTFQAGADAGDSAGTVSTAATFTGAGCATSGGCASNTVVNDISDMTVSLASDPATVVAGSDVPVLYTLTASYDSPAGTASSGVLTITATAPAGTVLVGSSPSCGTLSKTTTPTCAVSYDSSTGVITWTIGPGISAGGTESVTYQVQVDAGTPNGTTITNQANYDYSGDDPSTNPVGTGVTNNGGFSGQVTLAGTPSTVDAGSTTPVTFTVTAKNGGVSSTSDLLVITDPIPAGSTYVNGSASCGALSKSTTPTCTASEAGGVVTWTIGKGVLGNQTVSSLSFQVTVPTTTGTAGLSNTATWTGPGCTVARGCATNTVTITTTGGIPTPNPVPTASGTVTVTKTGSPTSVAVGSTTPITYTLAVDNTSSASTSVPVVVTDAAPAGTTFVAGSASCGTLGSTTTPTCAVSVTGSTITWTIAGGLAAGTTVDLTFQVALASKASAGTVITNTATWTGPGCTTAGGCTVTVSTPTTVTGAATFTVVKSATPTTVLAGSGTTVTYSLAVTNSGSATSTTSETVTDSAPAGTTYVVGSASCGSLSATTTPTCSEVVTGSTIVWTIDAGAPAGTTVHLSFKVTVDKTDPAGTTITNTARWTGAGCTVSSGCPSTTASVTVNPAPVTTSATVPTAPTTPVATVTPVTQASGGSATPIAGATTVHTGEPWAGSGRLVALVAGLGGLLLLLGGVRRRRFRSANQH